MEFAANAQENEVIAGRYRMGQLLGSGGFGAVYLATDERLHRPVAIKICSARRLAAAEAAEAAQLFEREALTLARLRHPGLTAIWDYFNIDEDWFLVMEYVPGETLRDRMRRAPGPLPLGEALHYASQICQVLQYLHSQHPQIVFRDLKPGNIMITPDERVKLIDFGIARVFSPDKSKDTVQFGTPGYAPPEQYGGQTEPRSDVYSLGVVLHQMLTGHNPASSPFRLPPARALNGAISEALEQLIEDATAYKIERRINSAEQFCSLLEAVRAAPAMTQQLPQTGAITKQRPAAGPVPRGMHTSQAWPHGPRTLPRRPTNDGFGHGLLVSLLVVLTLGALGAAGFFINNDSGDLVRRLFGPGTTGSAAASAPAASGTAAAIPSRLVFTAQTEDGGRELFTARIRQTSTRSNVAVLRVDDIQQRTAFGAGVEVADPAISPDGEQVAFAKQSTSANSAQLQSQVWVMDLDGTDAGKQVFTSYDFARAPAWSPDGTKLAAEVAAQEDASQQHDVAVLGDVAGAGGAVRVIAGSDAWEAGPAWSPDGREIAYHKSVAGVDCLQLFKIGVDGGAEQPLISLEQYDCSGDSSGDQWADWGASGITFTRRNLAEPDAGEDPTDRVALINAASQITLFRNQIVSDDNTEVRAVASSFGRWARGGTYLLFEEARADGYGLGYLDATVKVATEDGGTAYPLFTLALDDYTEVDFADWW